MKFSAPYIFLLIMLAYFPILVMKSETKNRVYIGFVLYMLPFMIFDLMPKELVVTVFDIVSYMYLAFFMLNNKPGSNTIYGLMGYALFIFLLIGAFNSDFIMPALMSLMRFLSIFIFCLLIRVLKIHGFASSVPSGTKHE